MTSIKLKGTEVHTYGALPAINSPAPDFTVTGNDLKDIKLSDFVGKNIILNIFPSVDTAVCAVSVREFNQKAVDMKNTVVLCISADLPFAFSRFCGDENLNNVITASVFRHPKFGESYGVRMIDGPLEGLLSRAIVIIDDAGKVIYTEQVEDIVHEPNYENALKALTS